MISLVPKFDSAVWIKINCSLTLVAVIFLVLNYTGLRYHDVPERPRALKFKAFSGCCTFPCLNGVCVSTEGNDYRCICPNSNYFGKNCENVKPIERLKNLLVDFDVYEKYSVSSGNSLFWRYMNKWLPFSKYYNKKIYNLQNHIITDDSSLSPEVKLQMGNVVGRSLVPVPSECPTPMGIKGQLQLPNIDVLYEELLKRSKFQPCKRGTNFLFVVYIQHFLTQFLDIHKYISRGEKPEYLFNMAHIYGYDYSNRQALRAFKDGKLKTRIFKNEEYPPFMSDCPEHHSHYSTWFFENNNKHKWAIGRPELGENSFLFVMSTIWLREHNRVCDILVSEHRDWTDEKLYETAKLIVTGETIKITLTEYLQHLLQFDLKITYEPSLLRDMDVKYGDNVPTELFLVPLWHTSMPDELTIDNVTYSMKELTCTGSNIVFRQGLDNIINAMTVTSAGEFTFSNTGNNEEKLMKNIIQNGRDVRLQSFNNYRHKFGLKPFKTFYEITDNVQLAEKLQNIYFDIDALELSIGLLVENKKATVVPPGMTAMAGSWFIHLLLSHPLNSADLQRPEVLGGSVGLNIIKSATLKKLFCLNLSSRCKHVHIDFKIPQELMYKINDNY